MNPPPHLQGRAPRGSLLGRLLLTLYHAPLARLEAMRRQGFSAYFAERSGEAAMRRAAPRIPVETRAPISLSGTPIVFLTGARYWHETLFCIRSLLLQLPSPPPIRIVSDGTLGSAHVSLFRRILPHAKIITTAEVEKHLADVFPVDRFPLIRFYREQKPIIRKLTDVFALSPGPQLLLDSDMLFFQRPDALLAWLDTPRGMLAMRDVKEAYGYSPALMQSLAGAPLPSAINIGVYGMSGHELDWPLIESWIRTLTETEGLQYNLCQGLSALLFARSPHSILDAREYLVLPDRNEILHPSAIMHHYVAESKHGYRHHAWRRFIGTPSLSDQHQ